MVPEHRAAIRSGLFGTAAAYARPSWGGPSERRIRMQEDVRAFGTTCCAHRPNAPRTAVISGETAMALKRFTAASAAVALSCNAEAADLLCSLNAEVRVSPSTLQASNIDVPRTTHWISGSDIYINDPSAGREYVYGKLVEAEPRRYRVGHKTYIFDDEARSRGIVVHASDDEVRISKLTCR